MSRRITLLVVEAVFGFQMSTNRPEGGASYWSWPSLFRSLGRMAIAAIIVAGCSQETSLSASADEIATGVVGGENIFEQGQSYRSALEAEAAGQEFVVRCMAEAGFEFRSYEPSSPPTQTEQVFFDAYDPDRSSDEFARLYGYGLATLEFESVRTPMRNLGLAPQNYFDLLQSDPQALGSLLTFDESVVVGDPNTSGFSLEELDAYEVTLHGSENEQGCFDLAFKDRSAGSDLYRDSLDEIEAFQLGFSVHPVVIAYYSRWSSCMQSEFGYGYVSPLEAYLDLKREFLENPPPLDMASFISLETAAEEERRIALASISCGEPTNQLLAPNLTEEWRKHVGAG